MITKYDLDSAPVRAWFKFTPEMDLALRFGVTKCSLVLAPRSCDGMTKWCEHPSTTPGLVVVGCENFEDKCGPLAQIWDGHGDWKAWVGAYVKEVGFLLLIYLQYKKESNVAGNFQTYYTCSKASHKSVQSLVRILTKVAGWLSATKSPMTMNCATFTSSRHFLPLPS